MISTFSRVLCLYQTFWEVYEDSKPLVFLVILNRVNSYGKQALGDSELCSYSFKLAQVEKINIQPEKGGKNQLWKTCGSHLVNLLHHKVGEDILMEPFLYLGLASSTHFRKIKAWYFSLPLDQYETLGERS